MTKKKKLISKVIGILFLAFITMRLDAQNKMWISGYYAGWMQGQNNDGYLTTNNIDFSALTQVIQFSLVPNADGTIDAASNSITQANSAALISAAHAAGVKVIICIGGWNSESNFMGATSLLNLTTFVNNIISFITSRGYDGVDIDWETLSAVDIVQYTAFITALRTALNNVSPKLLLTAATAWQPALFATLSGMFDQIDLMTYDFSGAWPGWVSWFNSPVFDGGIKFPSNGNFVPSINDMVALYTAAGVPKSKLGIGIDFYGYVWSGGNGTPTGGVTAPDQTWTTAPTVQANVPYYTIMQQYYQSSYYRWDSGAQSSYLSIDNPGSTNDKFISYDDEATCKSKVNYVKSNGLGGAIIWELGGGYLSAMPAGQQQPLLEAIKSAVSGDTVASAADTTAPAISFTSPSNNSTISGNINITVNASDNVGVTNVAIKIDGTQIGNSLSSSPFTEAWNSSLVSNGSHTITATASDAAGNSTTASITVTVSNAAFVVDTSNLMIYHGKLASGWNNTSWNVTANFTNSNIQYINQNTMNIIQDNGGALRLLSGSWSSPVEINPTEYKTLQFAIFGEGSNLNISVYLENSSNGFFPTVKYGIVQANKWSNISLSLFSLDPNNLTFDRIVIEDVSGKQVTYDIGNLIFSASGLTAVASSNAKPTQFKLEQNYPNPFNPSTNISFSLSSTVHVTLNIYNVLGEKVATLINENLFAGEHNVSWNALNLSSGVYIYRLKAGNLVLEKKMELLK